MEQSEKSTAVSPLRSSLSSGLADHYKAGILGLLAGISSLAQDKVVKERSCDRIGQVVISLLPIAGYLDIPMLIDDPHGHICIRNLEKGLQDVDRLLRKCASSPSFSWMVHRAQIARELADASAQISHSLLKVQSLVENGDRKILKRVRDELLEVKYKVPEYDWRLAERLVDVMKAQDEELQLWTMSKLGVGSQGQTAESPPTPPDVRVKPHVTLLSTGTVELKTTSTSLSPTRTPDHSVTFLGSKSHEFVHPYSDVTMVSGPMTSSLPLGSGVSLKSGDEQELRRVLQEAASHLQMEETDVFKEFAELKIEMIGMGLLRPLVIDPTSLEFDTIIGSGGGKSAGVWSGKLLEQGEDGRQLAHDVAIKRFPCGNVEHKHISEEFKKEVSILHKASARCPNVCKLYGICKHDIHLCIVMKLYKQSLQDIIKKAGGPMSLADVEGYAIDMCKAVMQLHREHVIVQDIKPANFLEDEDGQLVLADFGISRIVERTNATYTPTAVRGTSRFMSPEAWAGKAVRAQSDIWSVGCTLLTMITGKVPFPGLRDNTVAYKVLHQHEKPQVPAGLPKPLNNMLLRCFEYNPFDRPQAHELLAFFLQGIGSKDVPLRVPLADAFIERSGYDAEVAKNAKGCGDVLIKLTDLRKDLVTPLTEEQSDFSLELRSTTCILPQGKAAKLHRLEDCALCCTSKNHSCNEHRSGRDRRFPLLAILIFLAVALVSVSITVPIIFIATMRREKIIIRERVVPDNFSRTGVQSSAWRDIGNHDEERKKNLMEAVRRALFTVQGVPCLGKAFFENMTKDHVYGTASYMCTYLGGPLDMPWCQYKYPKTTEVVRNDYRLGEAMLAVHDNSMVFMPEQQLLFVDTMMRALKSVAPISDQVESMIESRMRALDPVIINSHNMCKTEKTPMSLPWRKPIKHDVTIRAGEAVTWFWDDDLPHSIKAVSPDFEQTLPIAIGTGDLAVGRTDLCSKSSVPSNSTTMFPIPCTLEKGQFTFTHHFSKPGNYTFVCSVYPDEMSGTVVVV